MLLPLTMNCFVMWKNNGGINLCVAYVGGSVDLNKLVQNKDCFICDFVVAMKLIQVDF
jgi:hypothetical protein